MQSIITDYLVSGYGENLARVRIQSIITDYHILLPINFRHSLNCLISYDTSSLTWTGFYFLLVMRLPFSKLPNQLWCFSSDVNWFLIFVCYETLPILHLIHQTFWKQLYYRDQSLPSALQPFSVRLSHHWLKHEVLCRRLHGSTLCSQHRRGWNESVPDYDSLSVVGW